MGDGGADQESVDSVTLDLWVSWSGEVISDLERLVERFEADHPGVTVNIVPDVTDPAKILGAITAGRPPDVAGSFKVEQMGRYCSSGAWSDLTPRIEADAINLDIFPPVARTATRFADRQCALPHIADSFGLYYNRALLAEEGYSEPPRTMSELTAMAKKLTRFGPDGSIEVAGFVPLFNWYQNYLVRFPPLFEASYFDGERSAVFTDPDWADLFRWQRSLIDFYGYESIARFAAEAGEEFSASHAFETGKVAMHLDGEWRTQAIEENHPDLDYATAPVPVSDAHPDLYGAGHVTVGFLVLPQGSDEPDLAWELMKFLAIDTDAVVQWSNTLRNIPTTLPSLESDDLELGANFSPFLTVYSHPKSSFPTVLEEGAVYLDPLDLFGERWQSGQISDLDRERARLAEEIDALVARAG